MPSHFARLAGWLIRQRWLVIGIWLLVLLGLSVAARTAGSTYQFDVALQGSPALAALEKLNAHSDGAGNDTVTIAWKAKDQEGSRQAEAILAKIRQQPHVSAVAGPKENAAQTGKDGISYAIVTLDQPSLELPTGTTRDIVAKASPAENEHLLIGAGGAAVSQGGPPGGNIAELIGMLASAIILLLAFGSLTAAALPLATALIALGSASAAVSLLTHAAAIPPFAPQLVSLIVIGVGIDYALFIVSRMRSALKSGRSVNEAIIAAYDTSGRAVAFAGIAVAISLGGLILVGIGFLNGLAAAASLGVLFAVAVSLTLTPALLSLVGIRVLSRRERRALAQNGPMRAEDMSPRWQAWAAAVSRRPWTAICAGALILGVLAIPAAGLRLGSADQGSDPQGSPTRVAYDLISEGFGPGMNGPLLLVSENKAALEQRAQQLQGQRGVLAVSPTTSTPDGKVHLATVIPATGPQDERTSELIAGAGSADVLVTGYTAVMDDFAQTLQQRLPWFLLGVIGLSSLLLALVFRSLAIPLKAAIMNLAAAAASFGVLVAVFQWGWGLSLLGIEKTGPVDAFLPVMLLAILFGLSMDYQVFLVSRIKEEWDKSGDNDAAVRLGLGETGRVITAAAMIMVCVFAAFAFAGNRTIAMFGVGLATAIFLDAFVIRSLLVPALMKVLGTWNWWLPAWLERILPNVSIEGHEALAAADTHA